MDKEVASHEKVGRQAGFSRLMAAYERYSDLSQIESRTSSLTDEFHDLPNEIWKRAFLRRVTTDIAVDYDVKVVPDERSLPTAVLTPNPNRQSKASALYEDLTVTGHLPEPDYFDSYLFLGQWNRAQLTAFDPETATSRLLSIAKSRMDEITFKSFQQAVEQHDLSPENPLIFELSKSNRRHPFYESIPVQPDTLMDAYRLSRPTLAGRLAALTATDMVVRRNFSTRNDNLLRYTSTEHAKYIAPFSNPSPIRQICSIDEISRLIHTYGFSTGEVAKEFGMSTSSLSHQLNIEEAPDYFAGINPDKINALTLLYESNTRQVIKDSSIDYPELSIDDLIDIRLAHPGNPYQYYDFATVKRFDGQEPYELNTLHDEGILRVRQIAEYVIQLVESDVNIDKKEKKGLGPACGRIMKVSDNILTERTKELPQKLCSQYTELPLPDELILLAVENGIRIAIQTYGAQSNRGLKFQSYAVRAAQDEIARWNSVYQTLPESPDALSSEVDTAILKRIRNEGSCKGHLDTFFPYKEDDHLAEAKVFCDNCTVSSACATHALVKGERAGIWSGFTYENRVAIRRTANLVRFGAAPRDD